MPPSDTPVIAIDAVHKGELAADVEAAQVGKVERAGYALIPLDLHYSKGLIKLAVGLAKGKRQFEKRAAEQDRDWKREQQRLLRRRQR